MSKALVVFQLGWWFVSLGLVETNICQLTIWAWFASWVYDYSLFLFMSEDLWTLYPFLLRILGLIVIMANFRPWMWRLSSNLDFKFHSNCCLSQHSTKYSPNPIPYKLSTVTVQTLKICSVCFTISLWWSPVSPLPSSLCWWIENSLNWIRHCKREGWSVIVAFEKHWLSKKLVKVSQAVWLAFLSRPVSCRQSELQEPFLELLN